MVSRVLIVALATLSGIISNASGVGPVPGVNGRFKINTVTIDQISNKYISNLNITPNPDSFSSSIQANMVRILPEDSRIKVEVKYENQDIISSTFSACSGADRVLDDGLCELLKSPLQLENWVFPIDNIIPNVEAGQVTVQVLLESGETEEVILRVSSTGEVIMF